MIVTIHSYKGGTGKTLLSLNLAAMFAQTGKKVCLIDMDFRAPSLCATFEKRCRFWFNDYLCGAPDIEDVLTDCTTEAMSQGKLFVGLANPSIEVIRDMTARDRKCEIEALSRLISLKRMLVDDLKFDYVFLDTSPGLQFSSINAIVIADFVLLVVTTDETDIRGTYLMIRDVYDLFEKKAGMVVNKMPPERVSGTSCQWRSMSFGLLHLPIIGALPCFCDIPNAEGKCVYALQKPTHPFTLVLRGIAETIESRMPDKANYASDKEETSGASIALRG